MNQPVPSPQKRAEPLELRIIAQDGSVRGATVEPSGKIRWEQAARHESSPLASGGLVDLQANGFAGVDFHDPALTGEDMDRALASMLACGTTRCLPTLISGPVDEMAAQLTVLDQAVAASTLGRQMVLGYHIEGPFLSPLEGYHGAHNPAHMIAASADSAESLISAIKFKPIALWTVAPEIDGVLSLIEQYTQRGIAFAIGHTAADAEQVAAAAKAGAVMSTHLGNALPQLLPKRSNPLLAQLACDDLSASLIADGHHLSPHLVQTYFRAKQLARTILITDATAAAGPHAAAGTYSLNAMTLVRDEDGLVHKPGANRCAGSSATMAQVAANASKWLKLELADLVRIARDNPLAAIGMQASRADDDTLDLVEWHQQDGVLRAGTTHLGAASMPAA